MSVYMTRLLNWWLPRWYVLTTLFIGAIMSAMAYDRWFSHTATLFLVLYSIAGVLGAIIVVSTFGIANESRQREFMFLIGTVIPFLAKLPIGQLLGYLGSLMLSYVATISLISLIGEIRHTHALFHRLHLNIRTVKAYPEVSHRPDWLVAQDSWEIPPKRRFWHSLFSIILIAVALTMSLFIVSFVFYILLD